MQCKTQVTRSPRARSHSCRPTPLKLTPWSSGIVHRRQSLPVCRGYGDIDPYTVLGVAPDADQNTINRAYAKKKSENKGNSTVLAQVEAAHSKIMMSALTARLKGSSAVPKSVRYADREVLFPWKPKRWDATSNVIMIVGGVQLAMTFFAFKSPNISRLVGCLIIGAIANVVKQSAINPPPQDPSMATEEEQGRMGQNLVRGSLLAVFATGIALAVVTVIEYIKTVSGVVLPPPFDKGGLFVSLKVAAAALSNWVMTSFYY